MELAKIYIYMNVNLLAPLVFFVQLNAFIDGLLTPRPRARLT